ncbi:MAG TPA: hypothetical protein VLT32_08315 [Candidatus Sulfomarinibacteraceae bacterium]|nr:hypothetical protein [Candidatus Sulfomarinibacteraceae bacterium]
MSRKVSCLAFTLTVTVLVAIPAISEPTPAPVDERRISAEEAAASAVNKLTERGAGYHLQHPRREVSFTPDGVRVKGKRGAPVWTWSLERIADSTGRVLNEGGSVAPLAVDPTLVRYDRCLLFEDYRLKQNSIEQLLVIPEPLALGGGDLVVTGRVACDGELTATEQGWTWRDEHGEITLGPVTVLDADGATLPAHLEVTVASTRLVVDGDALLTAAYPVVVDPEIGSNDYRISDMGPNGDNRYYAHSAAVAYNSIENEYLVVWAGNDDQNGLVDGEVEIFGQLVYGNTGSQAGTNDVRISYVGGSGNTSYDAQHPAVAFNNVYNEYLVVWAADNPEEGCVDNEFEIWGQVLDENLDELYGGDFRISFNGGSGDSDYDADQPAVVYNPDADEYLVVWQADDNVQGMVNDENEIFAQRIYSTGILVGSNLRLSDMGGSGDSAYSAYEPDVAYNSRDFEYLAVWSGDDNSNGLVEEEFEVFGQMITWNGVGTGPNDFRISDMGGTGDPNYDAFHPSVAYNPRRDEYLVVWWGDDNVGGVVEDEFEVFSQRFTPDVVGLGPNDFRLSDVGGLGDPYYDVFWTDVAYSPILDQYLVVWAGEDNVGGLASGELEIFAQMLNGDVSNGIGPNDERISDAGGIGDPTFLANEPAVAANTWNGQFMVAWHGDDNVGSLVSGEFEVFIQRMDGMAVFVDAFEGGTTAAWSSTAP